MMLYIYFGVGLYFLIKGADLLVDGAASLANRFKLNQVIIGLTIMAFGTSAPELFVSLTSVVQGVNNIAYANIFGSSVVNIFLVLGLASVFRKIYVNSRLMKLELPFTLLVSILLFFALNDNFLSSSLSTVSELSRYDGLVLLAFFGFFIWTLFNYKEGFFEHKPEFETYSASKTYVLIFFGFLALLFGSYQVVESAKEIASLWGVSDVVIGALMISLGTSLPEIVTSLTAYKKQNHDLMLGGVVGSNLFNILFILGIASVVKPLAYDSALNFHFYTMLFSNFLILLVLYVGRRNVIAKATGIMFVILYILYVVLSLS